MIHDAPIIHVHFIHEESNLALRVKFADQTEEFYETDDDLNAVFERIAEQQKMFEGAQNDN